MSRDSWQDAGSKSVKSTACLLSYSTATMSIYLPMPAIALRQQSKPDSLKWRRIWIAIFKILDELQPTAKGLDQIPAWFLHLAALVFYRPTAWLFNLSIATANYSALPVQACIYIPCPKDCYAWPPYQFQTNINHTSAHKNDGTQIVTQFLYPQ